MKIFFRMPKEGDVQVWWPTDLIGNGRLIKVDSVKIGFAMLKALKEYNQHNPDCGGSGAGSACVTRYDGRDWVKCEYEPTCTWCKNAMLFVCPVCQGKG